MNGTSQSRTIGFFRSLVCAVLLCTSVSIVLMGAVPEVALAADAPSVADFGQPVMKVHRPSVLHQNAGNALFVTEHLGGRCNMEEHVVVDDGIVGFRGEVPAWRLNVPLTWYFMEPVYERHATEKSYDAGRIAV